MNWARLAQALAIPILIAIPLVALCWAKRWMLAATITGSALFFIAFIVFAGMEYHDAVSYRVWCQQTNTPCRASSPSDFNRIVAYAGVAMVQVMALYVVAGSIEQRMRDGERDMAWR